MNIPSALALLAKADITGRSIAWNLSVTVRTVQRWRAGRHQPNPRHLAALRDMVDDLHRGVTAEQSIDWRLDRLYRRIQTALHPKPTKVLTRNVNGQVVASHNETRVGRGLPRRVTDTDPFALCQPAADPADALF